MFIWKFTLFYIIVYINSWEIIRDRPIGVRIHATHPWVSMLQISFSLETVGTVGQLLMRLPEMHISRLIEWFKKRSAVGKILFL